MRPGARCVGVTFTRPLADWTVGGSRRYVVTTLYLLHGRGCPNSEGQPVRRKGRFATANNRHARSLSRVDPPFGRPGPDGAQTAVKLLGKPHRMSGQRYSSLRT